MTPKEFYAHYKPFADGAAAGTTVFPDTILAAAALESGYGKSVLAASYNNFFGIKASPGWTGKTIIMPTHEEVNGHFVLVNAAFRHYDTPEESFKNYVHFISGPRYVTAGVLRAQTPADQFEALHKAGYATDSHYVEKLKSVLASFGTAIVTPVPVQPHTIEREFVLTKNGKSVSVKIILSSNDKPTINIKPTTDSVIVSLVN